MFAFASLASSNSSAGDEGRTLDEELDEELELELEELVLELEDERPPSVPPPSVGLEEEDDVLQASLSDAPSSSAPPSSAPPKAGAEATKHAFCHAHSSTPSSCAPVASTSPASYHCAGAQKTPHVLSMMKSGSNGSAVNGQHSTSTAED